MADLLLVSIAIGVAFLLFVAAFLVSRPRRPRDDDAIDRDDDAAVGASASTATAVLDAPTVEAPPVEDAVDAPPADAPVDVIDLEAPPAAPPSVDTAPPVVAPPSAPPVTPPVIEELPLRERFRRRLARTRNVLGASVADLFGRGVSDEAWEGLEEALIAADVGVETSLALVEQVRERARSEGATTADAVVELLKDELRTMLGDAPPELSRATDGTPTVWLVTGVNGTGKTTTIGKLAASETRAGRQVVLAAADTFRAAAIDQLGLWAERAGARLVRQDPGSDPAAVAYDGYNAARATDADVLVIDTAGRLHNKTALMDELGKVKRVVEKQAGPLDEVLLVLDATTGQNGVTQARAFLDAVDVTGLVLTKLDGTAKGGIVVAVQRELGIPVKLVGLGEGIDDLAPFDPAAFVDALFEDVRVA